MTDMEHDYPRVVRNGNGDIVGREGWGVARDIAGHCILCDCSARLCRHFREKYEQQEIGQITAE